MRVLDRLLLFALLLATSSAFGQTAPTGLPLPALRKLTLPLPPKAEEGESAPAPSQPSLPRLSDLESPRPEQPSTIRLLGPGEGGGGDPMTAQFLAMARQLAIFFVARGHDLTPPFEPKNFEQLVNGLEASVRDETLEDLVAFTDQPLADAQGVPKAAFFHRGTGSVTVSRSFWRQANDHDRLVLIAMELMGLLDVRVNRYESASALIRDREAVILSTPLPRSGAYEKPGWRIAGQDPNQFGRLSRHDFLIDAGTLGARPEITTRFTRFIDDPGTEPRWLDTLAAAERAQRPAYLLVAAPQGRSAAVFMISKGRTKDGRTGWLAYGLLFQKRRQIYEGPCADSASTLEPLERLLQCFLDSANYNAFDTLSWHVVGTGEHTETERRVLRKTLGDMARSILETFAQDAQTLEEVARTHLLMDYSPLVIHETPENILTRAFRLTVLRHTVHGSGLEPRFAGPYAEVPFWALAPRAPLRSVRFLRALETLAADRLGFVDDRLTCGEISGPALADLGRLRELRTGGHCRGREFTHFPLLETSLLSTMVRRGYVYNAQEMRWRKSVEWTPPPLPNVLEGEVGWLLYMRLITERLSPQAFVAAFREEIEQPDTRNRMAALSALIRAIHRKAVDAPAAEALLLDGFLRLNRAPQWLHSSREARDFGEHLFALTALGDVLSPATAERIRNESPAQWWFGQPAVYSAFEILMGPRSRLSRAEARSMMLGLAKNPKLSASSLDEISDRILASPACLPQVCAFGPQKMLPFTDRAEVLEALLKHPALSSESRENITAKRGSLALGVSLEKSLGDAPNEAKLIETLVRALSKADRAHERTEVVASYLIRAQMSTTARTKVALKLLEYLQPIAFEELNRTGTFELLQDLVASVEFDEAGQEGLYALLFKKASDSQSDEARASLSRLLIEVFDLLGREKFSPLVPHRRSRGLQRPLELMVIRLRGDDKGRNVFDYLLKGFEGCLGASVDRAASVCRQLRSPEEILRHAAENPSFERERRTRAAALRTRFINRADRKKGSD